MHGLITYLIVSLLCLFFFSAQPASSERASHFRNIGRGGHHMGRTPQADPARCIEGISCGVLGRLPRRRWVECIFIWTCRTYNILVLILNISVWLSFVSQNGARCKTSQPSRSRWSSGAWRSSPTTASRCWPTHRLEMESAATCSTSKPVKTVSTYFSRSREFCFDHTFRAGSGSFFALGSGCRGCRGGLCKAEGFWLKPLCALMCHYQC